ncbi:MAG TPA: hypothetical protein K8V30_02955 [Metalysinibacillus jejuensis]|uniref:YpoC-like domain-containing protein n=1 Tax=Metalysinibacillus jejuensis TaxID=914327 RepID=A0A921NBK2_9BACL|nr:hypothetical protein [Metalysinibacillus jejuensis]HJH10649.1 hypothetical protein [Metalysinibacillus jejuensis]
MSNLSEHAVNIWYDEWLSLQKVIHTLHSARDKGVKVPMEEAIAHYESFVTEELLPTNGAERLAFIKARPAQYACYRQLDELYKETKKRIARVRIQRNK